MKNVKKIIFILWVILVLSIQLYAKAIPNNRLNWMKVANIQTYTQIMFDFAQPIKKLKKKLNADKTQLTLFFPGTRLKNFKKKNVIKTLNTLKEKGLIENVTLHQKNKTKPVELTIKFAKYKPNSKKHKQKLLIKFSKIIDDTNKLILDIFDIDTLKAINKNNDTILHAYNYHTIVQYDTSQLFAFNQTRDQKKKSV